VGANVREAQRAVSRADFINKMGIALKEAEETAYWIELINFKVFRIDQQLNDQLTIITRLLVKIITTSKRNNGDSQK
jgi:four helix bundle protein